MQASQEMKQRGNNTWQGRNEKHFHLKWEKRKNDRLPGKRGEGNLSYFQEIRVWQEEQLKKTNKAEKGNPIKIVSIWGVSIKPQITKNL